LIGITAPGGLVYVPGALLVAGDATATANRIRWICTVRRSRRRKPLTPFNLGFGRAAVNGMQFFTVNEPGGLVGTLRFDAPTVILPPVERVPSGVRFTAPFMFNGDVTGFAPDDGSGAPRQFDSAYKTDVHTSATVNVTITMLVDHAIAFAAGEFV
jgi:hypothetical protein